MSDKIKTKDGIVYIKLGGKVANGRFALIDEIDLPLVSGYAWFYHPDKKGFSGYPQTNVWINGRRTSRYMHQILTADMMVEVDHKNGDGLDNRRQNLREANREENCRNRPLFKNNKSGFRGVHWHKENCKWRVAVTFQGRRKHIGMFDDIEDAARAFDAFAREAYEAHHDGHGARENAVQALLAAVRANGRMTP